MPLEYGVHAPWLDNWPIQAQLWQPGDRLPGNELDLSVADVGGTPRNLTFQWRNQAGGIDLAYSEQTKFPASLDFPERGVVSVTVSGDDWNYLKTENQYTLEIIAYGLLYLELPFSLDVPQPGSEVLNGVSVYGSPRQILELLGPVPGASVSVSRDLSGWTLNSQGYWTKSIPADTQLFGLWIEDKYARMVDYEALSLSGERAWSRDRRSSESHTLYYKGPENLENAYVETAFSIYVFRCLKEATAEVDRRTGRHFNLRRIFREVHRGLNRHRQLICRQHPIRIDSTFRLDALSYTRSLYRRYTEDDFDATNDGFFSGGQVLHADPDTGVITINQNVWDWWEWGNNQTADYGLGQFAFLPRGENNIEVTYVAGYETTPPDIDEGCCNLAAVRQGIYWNQAISQGFRGMDIGCVKMNFESLFSQWFPLWNQTADRIIESYQAVDIEGF